LSIVSEIKVQKKFGGRVDPLAVQRRDNWLDAAFEFRVRLPCSSQSFICGRLRSVN
jgi:hypothetical protein